MPTPVVVIDSGGVPITNTTLGVPMTPVADSVGGMPVTIVDEDLGFEATAVNLVDDDLVALPNIAPEINFDDTDVWTLAGSDPAEATDNTFTALVASAVLAKTPPLTIGRTYYYCVSYTITGGMFQIVNGTGTTVLIAESATSGTLSGVFTATDTNFRLRNSGESLNTVTKLILIEVRA